MLDNLDINYNGYNDLGVGVGNGAVTSDAQNLLKALTAGDSANPDAMGTSGNTLQFESLEPNLIDALDERKEDFKLMKMQKRNPVGSTVHQYTQALDSGDFEGIGTAELGDPVDSDAEFARNTRNIKYFQTRREVTLQAMRLNPTVGGPAEATEEKLGIHTLLKGTEYYSIFGDEAVSPNLPDGYLRMIRDEAPQNIVDFKGLRLIDSGAINTLNEGIRKVWDQGGEITDAFFPSVIAQDWQSVLADRLRVDTEVSKAGLKLMTYQTMYGRDIWISGRAGITKMFRVKTVPTASSNTTVRPNAPSIAGAAQASTGGTGFVAETAGTYRYSVHAVDASGLVSVASNYVNVVLAAGEEAAITITPDGTKPGTGYIVCRGKKDVTTGTDTREMFKIADGGGATTEALDQNDELPGTAEMLLMSSEGMQNSYQWNSFMDLMRFDLGRVRASIPFLLVQYGAPDLKIAKHNSVIKNIGHADVADWF